MVYGYFLALAIYYVSHASAVVFQEFQPGCNLAAALACEYNFLQCRLFSGPADDPATMCACGEQFYGQCLREAGCQTHMQASASPNPTNYMAQCVDLIIQYNCPSTLMCSINCASEGSIDKNNVLIMPFSKYPLNFVFTLWTYITFLSSDNYGKYHLRMRFCTFKTHPQRLSRYSTVDQVPCNTNEDFLICSRWIPPLTFVPVAFITNTTYMEVDSCEVNSLGQQFCRTADPSPVRLYGNSYMFPSTFDVAQTTFSICTSNKDCLGSFCDFKFHPPVCSPKTLVHVKKSGAYYFSDPFGWTVILKNIFSELWCLQR